MGRSGDSLLNQSTDARVCTADRHGGGAPLCVSLGSCKLRPPRWHMCREERKCAPRGPPMRQCACKTPCQTTFQPAVGRTGCTHLMRLNSLNTSGLELSQRTGSATSATCFSSLTTSQACGRKREGVWLGPRLAQVARGVEGVGVAVTQCLAAPTVPTDCLIGPRCRSLEPRSGRNGAGPVHSARVLGLAPE